MEETKKKAGHQTQEKTYLGNQIDNLEEKIEKADKKKRKKKKIVIEGLEAKEGDTKETGGSFSKRGTRRQYKCLANIFA